MSQIKAQVNPESNYKISTLASTLSIFLALTACSSDDAEINTDYSALNKTSVSEKPLIQPVNSAFEQYVKNGIRLRLVAPDYPVALASVAEDNSNVSISSFSTTNVHEIGVDEADRLKFDGEYLYTVAFAGYQDIDNDIPTDTSYAQQNSIQIYKTDPSVPEAEVVASIKGDNDNVIISDLFLRADENQLVSVSNTQFYIWDAFFADSDWLWNSGKTQIELYDVSVPESPITQWKIEIEGNLEGSRRVDNHLYLVTRYIPNIADINYSASTDEEKKANERLILNTPMSDLLPHYQTNNGAIRSLVSAEDCFVAEDTASTDGYADVVTLTAIDLDSQSVSSSVCLNVNVQGIYSSTSGFYIGGSSSEPWFDFSNLSAVHKFALNNGDIQYRASGAVPGYLGWSQPSFRMSEFNGDLRIVTTDFNGFTGSPTHQLNILREDGSSKLQTIASLPNETNPEPIGKEGEDIFAVRFSGDKAYVVTFQRIDPLYVIDLQNPEQPQIAGELEIPGFSRYLHELEEGWLLGIGKEVIDGSQQGVKVELYDVRDSSQPKVASSLIFGDSGTHSEALWDLRAISLLNVDDNNKRLALPINIRSTDDNGVSQWTESGLFGINIIKNGNAELGIEMSLASSGKLIAEEADSSVNQPQTYSLFSGIGRSVLLNESGNDALFYLHGNQVISTRWGVWE
ncbi:MAG: beta-propeller domain-containing protein [Kangiellaceae bacterium]